MNKKIVVVLLILLVPGLIPNILLAADKEEGKEKKAWVAGKVYEADRTTPLEDIPIRLVNVENGEVTQEKTREEGCYRFKDVKKGTYSVAVTYKGQDYLLPEKIIVELLRKREVAVSVCVALSDKDNSLILLDKNCHVCLGSGFPPLGIFLISGTAGIVGGIPIGRAQDPVVSESRP